MVGWGFRQRYSWTSIATHGQSLGKNGNSDSSRKENGVLGLFGG